ncbi:MAG TPA: ABC transporter permease [Acidimicrobiales bacterium]|nr:ABC transporter permease [Acidimicrobiales bacterium]
MAAPTISPAPAPGTPGRRAYTYMDAVRSEWTKFRSVRSTYWTFLVAAVLGIGLAALICAISASHYHSDPEIRFGWNPTDRSIRSLELAQLAFAVLGVLVVTSEYSTGMIRTSLAAVPRRVRMMTAKLLVFGLAALVVGEIIAFASFLLGQALIHGQAPSASLHDHLVLRVVIGAGLYLTLIGIMGGAFAIILRHAAAGISVAVAMLFILPAVAFALPTSWSQPIEEYWPTNAGQEVTMMSHGAHHLAAWTGFGEMAGFVAVVLVIGLWLLERRDA